MRASELAGLNLGDVRLGIPYPYLQIRKTVAKGGKQRRVPLWWDAGTLHDFGVWRDARRAQGAGPGDPFVCCLRSEAAGGRLDRFNVRRRFIAGCKCLGAERVAEVTTHHGRHSFVSHALAGGRTLAEVRDAVTRDLTARLREENSHAFYERLRERYTITVEPPEEAGGRAEAKGSP